MWVQDYKPNARDWLSSYWKGFMSPDQMARIRNTGVPMDFLKEVSGCVCPPIFCLHLFACGFNVKGMYVVYGVLFVTLPGSNTHVGSHCKHTCNNVRFLKNARHKLT